ncbi:pullulanase-type alpha-1,6-glucosidase [Thalassotalea fusca]
MKIYRILVAKALVAGALATGALVTQALLTPSLAIAQSLTGKDKTYYISANIVEDNGAHWLTPADIRVSSNILAKATSGTGSYYLAKMTPSGAQIQAKLALLPDNSDNSDNSDNTFPHLKNFARFELPIDNLSAKQLIKYPLAVIAIVENNVVALSKVHVGNLLDALYTTNSDDADEVSDYGASFIGEYTQFKLWAPTARSINVLLFDNTKQPIKSPLAMTQDWLTGSWSVKANDIPANTFYQYQVTLYHPESEQMETITTTDPYSLSLSTNSVYSQVVDLTDQATYPAGWQEQQDNPVKQATDNIFYELHIGDFSAFDPNVSLEKRGKYAAFSQQNSDGIKHLKLLKDAGINTIHLLPSFDIGTVNEEKGKAITLNDTLTSICHRAPQVSFCQQSEDRQPYAKGFTLAQLLSKQDPKTSDAQQIVSELRTLDNYNWGYDPFHYTVPEGSYALEPDGITRIIEFREMVKSIHNMGFRVVMDVVYNHTHQAGLAATSVLDKIVPQYYHRLDPISGEIAQSTCCDNTATERVMMGKLMIDSLKVWAKHYKIDGFRFDLMAHQPKDLMLKAREAVREIDPDTYFYGEGWNFGEVANNQRFVQASQLELAGTGIGTFTDRLRDAVRGGAFTAAGEGIRKSQGIANGLADAHNELNTNKSALLADYLTKADQLRVGLAGNLASYALINDENKQVFGRDINYGGQPSGYALTPSDTINYVSKHDNQTLWDNNQYRLPFTTSTADRIRFHQLSLSYALLAQGIPFIHMGSELLRSKSFLRDSYDYGDWFNRVDFSYQTNNYHVGLPPKDKDEQNWAIIETVLDYNQGRDMVTSADIIKARDVFLEWVKIRMSSPLFRLNTAEEINQQVTFLNTGKDQDLGLIAMKIIDNSSKPNDSNYQEIIVFFNASTSAKVFKYHNAQGFELHPVQVTGVDDLLKHAVTDSNAFHIPKISTAVFVKKR